MFKCLNKADIFFPNAVLHHHAAASDIWNVTCSSEICILLFMFSLSKQQIVRPMLIFSLSKQQIVRPMLIFSLSKQQIVRPMLIFSFFYFKSLG
jgi:hypothetical protein